MTTQTVVNITYAQGNKQTEYALMCIIRMVLLSETKNEKNNKLFNRNYESSYT